MKINLPEKHLALKTTEVFLMAIGSVAAVAFVAALQWWVAILGAFFTVALWSLIYRMLAEFEKRLTEKL